jgi:integrase
MARSPRPGYWKARDGWYVTVGGTRHLLARGAKDKAKAAEAFHRLMASRGQAGRSSSGSDLRVRDLLNLFLDFAERERAPATYRWYLRHLGSFQAAWGNLPASKLMPLHVEKWVAGKAWNPSTRRGAISTVKRAARWAWQQGHLDRDPLAHIELPPMGRRTAIMGPEQVRAIVENYRPGDPFRVFLETLRDTGARPGEVARVTAAECDLDAGVWVFQKHKTDAKTGRPRVVHLPPSVVETCRRLAAIRPEGPLFRNRAGKPWSDNSLAARFYRLRKKLGLGDEATAYALRHGFATQGLARGIPIATVAELLGHTSTAMVSRIYGHLYKESQHLKDSLQQIVSSGQSGDVGPPLPGEDIADQRMRNAESPPDLPDGA